MRDRDAGVYRTAGMLLVKGWEMGLEASKEEREENNLKTKNINKYEMRK